MSKQEEKKMGLQQENLQTAATEKQNVWSCYLFAIFFPVCIQMDVCSVLIVYILN